MLRYLDFINEGTTAIDSENVRKSNELHKKFIDTINTSIDGLNPKQSDVYGYIDDVMTEWVDEGAEWELNNVIRSAANVGDMSGNDFLRIYYIRLDDKRRPDPQVSKNTPHIPNYSLSDMKTKIIK